MSQSWAGRAGSRGEARTLGSKEGKEGGRDRKKGGGRRRRDGLGRSPNGFAGPNWKSPNPLKGCCSGCPYQDPTG